MQTLTRESSGRSTNSDMSNQSRSIAIIAILLFALSGLISGFAVAAFIRPAKPLQPVRTNTDTTIPATGQGKTPTTSPSLISPIPLGYPILDHISPSEVADASTLYTVSIQAVDQSRDTQRGKPVHASNITCIIWLMKSPIRPANMPASRLSDVDTLQSPFPQEEQNTLLFDSTTQQIQSSNSKGQATWNYRVATSVNPGKYYLIVLTDWKGIHYNWWQQEITITKANN